MIYKCFEPSVGKEIANELLSIKAIKLSPKSPFTWASGWKSPIYCDNRLSLSYPRVRTMVRDELARVVRNEFAEADVIAGVATAGIPQGALIADVLGLPFIYVRSKSKSHGLTNQIEGRLEKGQKVVVIEDLVSTGGSSLAAVNSLRQAGADVLGMAAIFTYGFQIAEENFKKEKVDLVYLSEYSLLIELAEEKKYVDASFISTLNDWRKDPAGWNA